MLHIRKTPTKREREEYRRWLEKHKVTTVKLTKAQLDRQTQDFWAQRAQAHELRRDARGPSPELPSAALPPPELARANPLHGMEAEARSEYLRREAEAKQEMLEKQSRVAPAYNKGPSVFHSDGMLDSIRNGSHRRR